MKEAGKVVLLLAVMVGIALAPWMLLRQQGRRLDGAVHREAVTLEVLVPNPEDPAEETADEDGGEEPMPTRKRVELMEKAAIGSGSYASVPMSLTDEAMERLVPRILEQLQQLQEARAVPAFDPGPAYASEEVWQITFFDPDDITSIVQVLQMQLFFEQYLMDVAMDAETGILYRITVYASNQESPLEWRDAAPKQFAAYLGMEDASVGVIHDGYEGSGFGGEMVCEENGVAILYEITDFCVSYRLSLLDWIR